DAMLEQSKKSASSSSETIKIKDAKNKADKEVLRLKEELHAKERELVELQEAQTALESQVQELRDDAAKREGAAKALQQRAEAQVTAVANEDRAVKAYQKIKNDEKLREKTRKALEIAQQLLQENADGEEEASKKSA